MSAGNLAVDSNVTGLAYAAEVLGSPKVLPGTPIWYPIEANSYSEFGAVVKNVKREPINASRQKRKGAITALEVAAAFQLDFISKTPVNFMPGFMFAAWRSKDTLPTAAIATTAGVYNVASGGAAFLLNDLLYAEGFTLAANNGFKTVTTAGTATAVGVTGVLVETPPTGAQITRVGRQGAAGDYSLTVVGGVPQLNTVAGNFTTLGVIPGEWVFVGGDAAATQFASAGANGYYRVSSVTAAAIVFDRWPGAGNGVFTAVADAGATKTIQLFLGHVIKNESNPSLQIFQTYQFERFLGGTRYQYDLGCGANTLKLVVKEQTKAVMDLGFIGMDEDLTQVAAKAGTRVALPAEVMFTAASSAARLRLIGADGVTPLTSILTDYDISISNGISQLFGIGSTPGAVDLKAGDFAVSGTVEAYLSTLAAVAAVKANPDCSVDFAFCDNLQGNATGWIFDVPLLMLGNGRMKVEKDKPIKLPLTLDAAGHAVYNHTLMVMRFAYLPQLAL